MFLFILVVCCIISVSCSEKNDLITNSGKNEYINLKCDKNLFSQKDNIEKLKIAKRRFNQYVYQDEDNKYQVSLKDGKEINVSDDLFEFMKKALCLRKEKGSVELDADQSS